MTTDSNQTEAIGYRGRFLNSKLLLALCLATPGIPQSPAPFLGSAAGVFNIASYGARADGETDDTDAIQHAIDAASAHGGVVLVPPGRWLCKGHLTLKMGVHMAGMNQAPQSWEPTTGSILTPMEGRGNEQGPPFISMRTSTSVTGLTIYYPEQKVDDIQPYPWTIQIDADPAVPKQVSFDSTIANVTLINSFDGIRVGPHENGRHRIYDVNACVLHRGIYVDWTGDIGRIENVQFHSHFWANKAFNGDWNRVFNYMQQNLEAFVFGRTDWEYVTNTFVFPAKVGYRFIQTDNGAANGQFSGIGADATETAVLVEAIQPQGLQITNGEFNSHQVGASTQVIIAKQCRGNVRFVNCGFWGPVKHNAVLSGEGYTSFSDCYFSNDTPTTDHSIVAESGRVQIENCTFDARSRERKAGNAPPTVQAPFQPPCIDLQPGVKHAIVTGNNGYYGVRVRNQIGTRAIIANNEPDER